MLRIERMFISMVNNRVSKWWLLLTLLLVILSIHQFLDSNQPLRPELRSSMCLNRKGTPCVSPKGTTTHKPKVTKKINKKQVKDPNLKKVHIIPNAQKTMIENQIFSEHPKNNNTKTRTLPRKVLIVSYFDTGPPYIGEILGHHPDIFYMSEPLLPFDSSPLRNGEEPISRRSIAEAMDCLSGLFDCQITNEELVRKLSNKRSCREEARQGSNATECVRDLCKSKPVVMAGTIRIYVQDAQPLMARRGRGTVKVIILQRDPRVILHVHGKKSHPGWTTGSDMFFQGRTLCARMLHDVQNARRLEGSGHKDFYRIVLYEHFLKSPESVLKGILSFIGIHSSVGEVRKLLKSSNAFRQLQKSRANRWEWIPDDEAGVNVDRGCAFFYKSSLYNPMMQSPGIVQRYNLCQYCD